MNAYIHKGILSMIASQLDYVAYLQELGGNMEEQIHLVDVEGFARKSGTDEHGCKWIEFEVDYMAEQEAGECCICGARLEAGWLCLDGGDEVCSSHVVY